jgi:PPM family protein phosphatase
MIAIAGLTHPGNRPGENQDSIGWDEGRRVALVADGLGGHAGGQIASAIVRDTVLELVGKLDLHAAVMRAHGAVVEAAKQGEHLFGMASTIVAVQIAQRRARIAWAGDSRAYLWRGGRISRLTRDHSVVEELRVFQTLSEEQVREHARRNEVTNVLGAGIPEPSVSEVPLRRGDWILLCSDGLNGELRDEEIAGVLARAASPDDAAQALIAAVLDRGGRDNVSAVVLNYDGRGADAFALRLSDAAITGLVAIGGAVLAVIIASLLFWFRVKR